MTAPALRSPTAGGLPRPSAAPHPAGPRPTGRGRPLRLVQPDERSPRARVRRARLVALALTGVVAVVLFGVVSAHAVLTQGQLELDQLGARAAQAEARFQRLRLQVAELESPQRIVAVAQQRLGMVPPPGVTYLSPTGATAGELARSVPRPAPRPSPAPDNNGAWAAVKAQLDGRP